MNKLKLIVVVLVLLAVGSAHAARIKDIAGIGGVRENQLVGYGLVVGLMQSGDNVMNGFGRETIANMLSKQGLNMKDRISLVKAKNVASVMVTANLPPFARNGSRIDCMVSSMGDATSLQGGTLIMTPLRAADSEIYAVCQGGLFIGGFSAGGANATVTKNQTNVGLVPNGALVEREVRMNFPDSNTFTVNLFNPDFTTARQMALRVNAMMNEQLEATAKDSGTVVVKVKNAYVPHMMTVLAELENMDVPISSHAVVVMNEKTGTVVMGETVRISTVAVAHGNLSISIKENVNVSQPLPFAPTPAAGAQPVSMGKKGGTVVAAGGQTVVTKDTNISVAEEKKQLLLMPQGITIQEVVQGLNAIGVSPRDLITILQTIKAAGALQAELRII
ncbi:MAG: flagellar basal body P-ring protein FlgI [Syntrophales bacterium]|nr:flagellar basal body P-ring protein FlgI [Syntrophales bacterium]